jgi:hypothetical protein
MDQEHEDIGPAEVWQIRAFPRGLRQYLAEEARKEGIVVGDLLTRIVLAYRSGSLGKIAMVDGFANASSGAAEAALDRAIDRIRKLAEYGQTMPKEVATLAYGLVKADLRALKTKSTEVLKPRLTHQPQEAESRDTAFDPGQEGASEAVAGPL